MTFKRILVALDRSFQASCIFAHALQQAHVRTSSLLIVHTIRFDSNIPSPQGLDLRHQTDLSDMYTTVRRLQQKRIEQELQKAQDWLQMYYQQAMAKGVMTQVDCRVGEPGAWICDLAQTQKIDLIVLGRHSYRGLKDSALGSVSRYVIHHAPCSVLVVEVDGTQELTQETSEVMSGRRHDPLKTNS